MSESTSSKLTLSDISEKLLEKRIPVELLDEIYLYLDYSTLCTLNLTNEQWHSAYKRFIILPYDDIEDYHRLFLWWLKKTRKPFEIIDKDNSIPNAYEIEDHEYKILVAPTHISKFYFPYDNKVIHIIGNITVNDNLPFQVYKNLTDINKIALRYTYELTDENREELKMEIKTTHTIMLQDVDNLTFIKCYVEMYIAYFHINNMRIKVITLLIRGLPTVTELYNGLTRISYEYSKISKIFPFQCAEYCNFVYEKWSNICMHLYVPSMTTMDYNPDIKCGEDSIVLPDDLMFVQLRDILHKEITDRTLMFSSYW